jgi:hypothetical protein
LCTIASEKTLEHLGGEDHQTCTRVFCKSNGVRAEVDVDAFFVSQADLVNVRITNTKQNNIKQNPFKTLKTLKIYTLMRLLPGSHAKRSFVDACVYARINSYQFICLFIYLFICGDTVATQTGERARSPAASAS